MGSFEEEAAPSCLIAANDADSDDEGPTASRTPLTTTFFDLRPLTVATSASMKYVCCDANVEALTPNRLQPTRKLTCVSSR